jgi:nucleoside phosphorylase
MSIELIPAIAALDEEYDVENEGGYLYRRGKIGQHYVALVTLSQTGLAAAADAASRMSSVFTNIEIMLVVGIAGGTPSYESETKQIVLGDIVVSMPGPGHGGIFQYDSGAWDRDGRLKVLTHTNSPADRVKNLVNHLRGESISATLPQLLASMRSKIPEEFVNQYLDQILHKEGDRVFPSNYGHVRERELCTSCCEPAKAKQRSDRGAEATRKIDSPRVHYGCIGSTSQLQMSASMRDRLRDSSRQVLAYEMETSGVINTHSALAIRGICDYADSHKNKIWQKYASATAVAYAKVLLQNLPLSDAAKSRSEPVRKDVPSSSC